MCRVFCAMYTKGVVARITAQTDCSLDCTPLRRQRIALRPSQLRHPIQGCHFQKELRRLLGKGPCRQGRPENRLETKEGRLGQTPPMITCLLFPLPPPQPPHRPQVFTPPPGLACRVAMPPDLGIAPGRDNRPGAVLL